MNGDVPDFGWRSQASNTSNTAKRLDEVSGLQRSLLEGQNNCHQVCVVDTEPPVQENPQASIRNQ